MDTKFSVALHILTMISESKDTLSSQALATSVGTNASYIRKVIALLKNAGLIQSHQGKRATNLVNRQRTSPYLTFILPHKKSATSAYFLFIKIAIPIVPLENIYKEPFHHYLLALKLNLRRN